MASRLKITAEMRSDLRKSHTKAIRREGMIPATVYGSKIEGSVSVKVPLAELTEAVKEQGANVIIDLSLQDDGKDRTLPVMLHELQRDPRTRRVLHVDFRSIALDVKTNATVPVHLVGTAIGVTEEGGMIDQLHSELTVSALPTDIPTAITLDVSGLRIGDGIRIGDIKLEKAEVVGHEDEPVVLCRQKPLMAAEEEAAGEEGVEAAPESGETADSAEASGE